MKEFDYLVVGSGLFGAVFAREMTDNGKKVLVIDKRPAAGGNIRCEKIEGINCHVYGPHIFHTNDEGIWNYVNRFTRFNNFVYSPLADFHGRLFNLPFNMNTFYQIWKVRTPLQAMAKIEKQSAGIGVPKNLEEQAIKMVGMDLYQILVKGYTEKQWGKSCRELPPFIIKRLPVRYTFDNNYFADKWQGIPVNGYNSLVDGLLKGIETRLNTDFLLNRSHFKSLAGKVVYTGPLDEFYGYLYGSLEYRSLRFESSVLDIENHQGNAVINYTSRQVPYTRSIEHKHFEGKTTGPTVITREYPEEWIPGKEAFYPVNDERNNIRYRNYGFLAAQEEQFIFGGRLAKYKYYNMDQVIGSALKAAQDEIKTPAFARAR